MLPKYWKNPILELVPSKPPPLDVITLISHGSWHIAVFNVAVHSCKSRCSVKFCVKTLESIPIITSNESKIDPGVRVRVRIRNPYINIRFIRYPYRSPHLVSNFFRTRTVFLTFSIIFSTRHVSVLIFCELSSTRTVPSGFLSLPVLLNPYPY